MKQTIIDTVIEEARRNFKSMINGVLITKMSNKDKIEKLVNEYEFILADSLQNLETEVREKTLKEVNDFAFDLVWGCVPDCTPEEHQYHQGTWDSYLKLEKWAEAKLKELNTPQEGGME